MTMVSSVVASRARAMAPATACVDSGAGMIASDRAKIRPAANAVSWSIAIASSSPSPWRASTIGAIPW